MFNREAKKGTYKKYEEALSNGIWIAANKRERKLSDMSKNELWGLRKYIKRRTTFLTVALKSGYLNAVDKELEDRFPVEEKGLTGYEGLTEQEKIDKFLREKGATKIEPVEEKDFFEHRSSKKTYARQQFEKYEKKGLSDANAIYSISNIKPRDENGLIGSSVYYKGKRSKVVDYDHFMKEGKLYKLYVLEDGGQMSKAAVKSNRIPEQGKRERFPQSFAFYASTEDVPGYKSFKVDISTSMKSYDEVLKEAKDVFSFDFLEVNESVDDYFIRVASFEQDGLIKHLSNNGGIENALRKKIVNFDLDDLLNKVKLRNKEEELASKMIKILSQDNAEYTVSSDGESIIIKTLGDEKNILKMKNLPSNITFDTEGDISFDRLEAIPDKTMFKNSGSLYFLEAVKAGANIQFKNGEDVEIDEVAEIFSTIFKNKGHVFIDKATSITSTSFLNEGDIECPELKILSKDSLIKNNGSFTAPNMGKRESIKSVMEDDKEISRQERIQR